MDKRLMDIDEAIDLLIPVINHEPTFDFKVRFGTILKTPDLKFLLRVRNEMEDKGIIERVNPKPGYEYLYRAKGLINDIVKEGNWTKYKAKLEADKKVSQKVIVEHKTLWYDWVFRAATIFGIGTTFYFSYSDNENERKVHELAGQHNQQLLVLDSLTKAVLYRDSLLLTERARLKILVADSLDKRKDEHKK